MRPVLMTVRKPSVEPCCFASLPESASILSACLRQRGDVLAWHQHEVHGRNGLDVVEGDNLVVFVDLRRRKLAVDDPAENAVVHGTSCIDESALARGLLIDP